MQNAAPTSSAMTLDRETIDLVLERSRKIALEQAAQHESRVSDIAELQRGACKAMLVDAKGSDGEAMGQEDLSVKQAPPEIEASIKKDDAARMKNIKAAPDAYVFKRTGPTVGLQHDGTRRIGLADQVIDEPELAERVSKHEAAHRLQQQGNQVASVPETGDATIDADGGTIERLTFREDDAIKAEGGLAGHTKEYHGFVKKSSAVAGYLNENGESGDALVDEAGRTNEGFQKMRQAIVTAATRKKIEEQMKQVQQTLAA